jgi:hypothetical protein
VDTGKFSEESLLAINFVRCERPDGSGYGTGGTCRKGVQKDKAKITKLKAKIKEAKGVISYQLSVGDTNYAASWQKRLDEYQKELDSLTGTSPAPKPLAKEEEGILGNYIAGGSMETGSMLQTNWKLRGLSKTPISPEEGRQVALLDSALSKLPKNERETTHFRGVGLTPEQISKIKPGGSFKDPGFSSWSRDQQQAGDFASNDAFGGRRSVMFVSKNKNLRDVAKFSPEEYDDQAESILPRNTPMKVSRITNEGEGVVVYLD